MISKSESAPRTNIAAGTTSRRVRILLIYAVFALPVVVWGAIASLENNSNSPLHWVGSDFQPRRDYDAFCEAFGPGDVVVISWPGCSLDEARLDDLCDALRRAKVFHDEQGQWWFEQVTSGREIVDVLRRPPLQLPRETAINRVQGVFVGEDRSTTSVIVTFTEAALAHRSDLANHIKSAVTHYCEVPAEEQRLAGPVIDGLSVDIASQRSLHELALPSALLMLVIAWWALESVAAAAVVCGISYFCQAAALAFVHYSGDSMNALLIVMPPLIQALAVAGGIHLANYFLHELNNRSPSEAAAMAFRHGWLPCLLSGMTTALGLASLQSSGLVPIRAFGRYAASGAILTTFVLLALVPGILAMLPRFCFRSVDTAQHPSRHLWRILTLLLGRYHLHVATVGLAAMAVLGIGLGHLKTSVRIETLFAKGSRILDDYGWIERNIASMVPIEVLVTCDPECTLSSTQRLWLVQRLRSELLRLDGVTSTVCASTFTPEALWPREPTPLEVLDPIARQCEPLEAQMGYRRITNDREVWRITANLSALADIDYGEFIHLVDDRLNLLLQGEDSQPLPGVTLQSTGIMPLVHAIQGQLLEDLLKSFLTAFGLIAVVMIVVEAGVFTGLTAMVSNVFPALVLFGILGWTKIPLDIGSIMTASVALGIAVDDTLHLLAFFRRGLAAGLTRSGAIRNAYSHCGGAMIQTSLICGFGIGVFALSDFLPTSRFAIIMALQLLAALVGDLILLPSLLLGPLGTFFEVQENRSCRADEPSSNGHGDKEMALAVPPRPRIVEHERATATPRRRVP